MTTLLTVLASIMVAIFLLITVPELKRWIVFKLTLAAVYWKLRKVSKRHPPGSQAYQALDDATSLCKDIITKGEEKDDTF